MPELTNESNFGQTRPESASQRAWLALERMIVTLELAPGSVNTEGELIARIGLGRTPVREAIQRLAWDGLIEIRPRAGLAIAPLHPGDWLKVLDARKGVEVLLAGLAAKNMSAAAIGSFHDAAMAMKDAVEQNDAAAFLDADKSFDAALAEAAQNPFAARLAAPLQTHSRRFWFRYQTGSALAEAAANHVAIIQAILARDAELAGAEAARLMALLRLFAQDAISQQWR